MAENIPKKNYKIADQTLDESEIITRILFVMKNFHTYDLEKFDWEVGTNLYNNLFRNHSKNKELIHQIKQH